MKLSPLLLVPAASLETSSTAKNLLAAVGHRNVTHMEALIQGLADESVQVPAWKFDEDIRTALDAIRHIFVGSIQTALNDQHKYDQEHLNCDTETCFMGCINNYRTSTGGCHGMDAECGKAEDAHTKCRLNVYSSYIEMAKKCSSLHCFIQNWKDEECITEDCLCPDLMVCHTETYGSCVAQVGDCKATYGSWLMRMIQKFKSGFESWQVLHKECKSSYHAFLSVDMDCDTRQKEFESCKCRQNGCKERSCTVEFESCQIGCWDRYEAVIKEKECLEKDRKIDWSATKKIECYVDILLRNYTKHDLLTKCGTEDCVNVAREEDYKHCHTICLEVDYEGVWPEVHSVSLACPGDVTPYAAGKQYASQTAWIAGHENRGYHDQYHLGDGPGPHGTGHYDCDANGDEVMTRHRGGDKNRVAEQRCTEHLDIDYQIPPCCDCEPPPDPVCDEKFHCRYYSQYDDTSLIGEISDCCPTDCGGATCFSDVFLQSVGYTGGAYTTGEECENKFIDITIREHSHAWAYNRCRCQECVSGRPTYPTEPPRCGEGPHTILTVGYDIPSVMR